MSNEETIKELHEIKDLLCAAVRYNPDFTETKYIQRVSNYAPDYGTVINDVNKAYTIANNLTTELEQLMDLCAKNKNAYDINNKKFKLKEKIPVARVDEYNTKLQTALTKVENTQKYFLNNTMYPQSTIDISIGNDVSTVNNMESVKVQREQAANKLSVRLTELINMIPVKKIFQKKDNATEKKVQTPQRFEHLFEVKSTTELLPLTVRDSTIPIKNLHEFSGIKFYFRKSDGFSAVFLFYKGDKEYLVADDHKLYVLNGSAELVQGCHMDKLQFWKEKN